jgi:hypothetical protein
VSGMRGMGRVAGTRGGLGRLAAMVLALAAVLFLLLAGEARAGFYNVAQCGWGVGADADWWDSTGGVKFRPDSGCGDHLKSFTRGGAGTLTGGRFARWRWVAPPTTNIRTFRATWWHVLNDGFVHVVGGWPAGGDYWPASITGGTNLTPSEFSDTFTPSVPIVEDRLVCWRPDSEWCALDPESWSALRNVTLTIDDGYAPGAWITGGTLTDGGWRRGSQFVSFSGHDDGSGVRYGETTIDGGRVGLDEYPCAATVIEGELRATQMRPCYTDVSGVLTIDTTRFSDGPHTLASCEFDFAGVRACAPFRTVLIDNNPPGAPNGLQVAGGEAWRRTNDLTLEWTNPDQGPASPIAGAYYRLLGPGGYDSGAKNFVPGTWITKIGGAQVPGEGDWTVWVWLRDEAGNENPSSYAEVHFRFDAAPPTVAFEGKEGDEDRPPPAQVVAAVADQLSGAAGGTISYRRAEGQDFTDLPTKLRRDDQGRATLVAPTPNLLPGTWVFRAEALDGAGNTATTSLRGDGTQMSIHVKPADVAVGPGKGNGRGDGKDCEAGAGGRGGDPGGGGAQGCAGSAGGPTQRRAKTRLFVRLRGGHGKGDALTVPFGAAALLSGRLTSAAGAGLAGRRIKVVARPSHGALAPRAVERITTGERGGFVLRLGPGTSRRISVSFAGNDSLTPAGHRSLDLRVRSGVTLAAAPGVLHTGESVHLQGRVRSRGAPIPRRGKLVAIQYLEAETGRWRPVLVTRTDHDGRFHARYRFRYVSGAARIRLRAMALAEERWPYAPGSSPPVTVEVRGR